MEDKSLGLREGGRVLVVAELLRPALHRKGNSAQHSAGQGETHGEGVRRRGVPLSVLGAGSSLQAAGLTLAHQHSPTLFHLRV